MIKLIVCDLDGTLLDDNKKLDSGIFEVIPKLKEKGIAFTLASGRNEELLNKYVDELNIEIPYITNNGGNIYQKHICIENDCIESKYNNFIARTLYENDIPFRIFSIENIYAYSTTEFFIERMSHFNTESIDYHPDIDLSNNHVYKITSDYRLNLDKFDEVYKKIVDNCDNISYLQAEKHVYCINSTTANKGEALKRLCKIMDIDLSETMAFGDNGTDLPMITMAKVGVVTENGDEIVKKQSDYICKDNNSHGVSDFIKEYFNL